jgi:hypothetical protein
MPPSGFSALDCAIATWVNTKEIMQKVSLPIKTVLLPYDCSVKVDEGLENGNFTSSNMASREM